MLLLDAQEVRRLFPMSAAIESNKKAFLLHSEKKTDVPVRITFGVGQGSSSQFMPAYVKGDVGRVGIKIVSTYPGNTQKGLPVVSAQVLLLDHDSGQVCAMMNGTEITKIRTGAISGAATEILANEHVSVGALFGTGGQAESQLLAMMTVRQFDEIRVYDISPERAQQFIARQQPLAEQFNVRLKVALTADEAVEDADVITTVTVSKAPVFDGKRVKDGAHINGVGSYMPTTRELDTEIVKRARVFVDNREAVFAEAGDLILPVGQGEFDFSMVAGELGEVLSGKIDGRQSVEQITLMKTVGYAVLDVVAAWTVYQNAIAQGVGKKENLISAW